MSFRYYTWMSETKRPESYVGVSGVVSPEQQAQLNTLFQETGLGATDRILAFGVKATHKAQFNSQPNKYGDAWYPVGGAQFRQALESTEGTRSMAIAQAYFEPKSIDDPWYRTMFSNHIFKEGAPWIDGIQFDLLPWHYKPELFTFLEELKAKHDTKILLQVHEPAMELMGPKRVIKKLGEHAGALDYILFDASHGKGERLNVGALSKFLRRAYDSEELQGVGIALAGGLDGSIIEEELPTILNEFPDISWDAEGRLHPENGTSQRPLDMAIVKTYMDASNKVLGAT
jgi:hypothetical protein